MKKPASSLPDDQLIAKLKVKQSVISQKTTSKKIKITSSKQLKSLVDATIKVTFSNFTTMYQNMHQLTFNFF
jgi:hypothetical protein